MQGNIHGRWLISMGKKTVFAPPRIIALLTDFNWSSWYVGVMKGVIFGINPSVKIVDLCHDISSQDVQEGSFVLGNGFRYFPNGTIFLCIVDPGVGGNRRNLIIKTEKYYFIAPDNGILSCVFEKGKVEKAFEVRPGKYTLEPQGSTFMGRDVFAPVAAHLSQGVSPEEMGREIDSVLTIPAIRPYLNGKGELSGRVAYIDTFGNIITNISEETIRLEFGKNVMLKDISLRLMKKKISGIYDYYDEGKAGKLMALLNSWGYLEIAVNKGNACRTLGLTERRSLKIFLSKKEPKTGSIK